MADHKPLTKSDLTAALKEFRKQVRDDRSRDLKALRGQVRDDAFEDRTEFYDRMTQPEIGNLRKDMKAGFKQTNARLDKIQLEVNSLNGEVRGLKEELADTPSKNQIEKLKARVDRYHPTS